MIQTRRDRTVRWWGWMLQPIRRLISFWNTTTTMAICLSATSEETKRRKKTMRDTNSQWRVRAIPHMSGGRIDICLTVVYRKQIDMPRWRLVKRNDLEMETSWILQEFLRRWTDDHEQTKLPAGQRLAMVGCPARLGMAEPDRPAWCTLVCDGRWHIPWTASVACHQCTSRIVLTAKNGFSKTIQISTSSRRWTDAYGHIEYSENSISAGQPCQGGERQSSISTLV